MLMTSTYTFLAYCHHHVTQTVHNWTHTHAHIYAYAQKTGVH